MPFKLSGMLLLAISIISVSSATFANPIIPVSAHIQQPSFTPGTPNLDAGGYVLLDADSGKVLAEKNSDERMPPASLTKLMSMYIISEAIRDGRVKLEDKVRISTKAWKTEGSRMFVKANDEVPVKLLLQGIVVDSGNDATVAMAEHVAGTEEAFVSLMNDRAKSLGMTNSNFIDSTGLPNKEHYSTAHDLALLTQAYIKNFAEDYSLYSEKWFTYNNIKQPNRNRLLWRYQYADGLKTGHTSEAGFCLVGSAKKDGMRLITVVLGEKSDNARTEDSIRLMTYGFRFFETHKLYGANTELSKTRVWQGQKSEISIGIAKDLYITIPSGQFKRLQPSFTLNSPLKAPLIKGQEIGKLNITLGNQVLATTPIISLENNIGGGILRRATDTVKFNLHKYFSKANDNTKVNAG